MPGPPNNPHDALARQVLENPENAASELRSVLPGVLVSHLDLDRLTLVNCSFVDQELSSRYTDRLYRAPLDGDDAFVYVLIEHQSSTDKMMAFRMLHYLTLIWKRYLKEHPKAKKLPVVIPLVLYHDNSPWTAPVEVRDLVGLNPAWADAVDRYVPRLEFMLHDLTQVNEQALRALPLTPSMRATLKLLMVARGNTRLHADLEGWEDDMWAGWDDPRTAGEPTARLVYILTVSDTPIKDLTTFIDKLGPDAKESFMTTAEKLRTEGLAKGLAKGRTEGLAEGMVKGRAETVVTQMTAKFGELPDTVLATVRAATPDQLETWAVQILTANTIDEVLH